METFPLLMFEGPVLAGCREFASRLGWLSDCRWQIPQPSDASEWGRIGPAVVSWRKRVLTVDLGYRGPLWTPPLGSGDWSRYPGVNWQAFRRAREESLQRVAAVLFVVDSQRARAPANLERLERFGAELDYIGRAPEVVPIVFALNKRDLANYPGETPLLSVAEIATQLRWPVCEYVETSARTGRGLDVAVERLLAVANLHEA